MLEKYKTVYEGGEGEIIEKKSRFIATVRPVNTEEEALAFIEEMKKKYGANPRIDFRGSVSNVNYFLNACDAYISTSKSEGLPNGVLEAMATGLPVILSDIEQHKEIFEVDDRIGFLYHQNEEQDFIDKLEMMYQNKSQKNGEYAYDSAHNNFSAEKMSKKYQEMYIEIVE